MAWPVDRRSKAYRYRRGRFFEAPSSAGKPPFAEFLQPALDGSRRPRTVVKRGKSWDYPHALVFSAAIPPVQSLRSRPAKWLPKRGHQWEFAHLPVFTLAVFPPPIVQLRKRFGYVRPRRADIFDLWSILQVPSFERRVLLPRTRVRRGDLFDPPWQSPIIVPPWVPINIRPVSRQRLRTKRGEFDESFWQLPPVYPPQQLRRNVQRFTCRARGDIFDFWPITPPPVQIRSRPVKFTRIRCDFQAEAFWVLPPYYPPQWVRSRPARFRPQHAMRSDTAFWTLPPYFPTQWIRSRPGKTVSKRGRRTDAFWTLPPYYPTQWIRSRPAKQSRRPRGDIFDFWPIAPIPQGWVRSRPAKHTQIRRDFQAEVVQPVYKFIPTWVRTQLKRYRSARGHQYDVPLRPPSPSWTPLSTQRARTPKQLPKLFRRIWGAFWFPIPPIPEQTATASAGPFDFIVVADMFSPDVTAYVPLTKDATMSAVDLNFTEGNDPAVTFTVKNKASSGVLTIRDLSTNVSAIELFIKPSAEALDTDPSVIKYSLVGGQILIIQPGLLGQVSIQFAKADIGSERQFYHFDVVDAVGHRITYASGDIQVGEA